MCKTIEPRELSETVVLNHHRCHNFYEVVSRSQEHKFLLLLFESDFKMSFLVIIFVFVIFFWLVGSCFLMSQWSQVSGLFESAF